MGGPKIHNQMRQGVSAFPIYATLQSLEDQSSHKKLLSGIVIRGPNHSRMPTDRIPIITVELFVNNPENKFMTGQITNGIRYTGKRMLVLVRTNSTMKEDNAYCTFTSTSLFSPLNTAGMMIMENHSVLQDHNVRAEANTFIKTSAAWVMERFTESVLMAAIGNSRDEGYLANLRKIYMMMFSWREDNSVANWDIESFCNKTNDCLVDNPLSMHFHRTLLVLLKEYARCEKKADQK